MHENNFEKQVREKMEQLGFDPSEAVWAGVDKEINGEKKHRRPLFWIFFLSGLLLAGGGYYFIAHKMDSKIIPANQPQNFTDKKPDQQFAGKAADHEKMEEGQKKLSASNGERTSIQDEESHKASAKNPVTISKQHIDANKKAILKEASEKEIVRQSGTIRDSVTSQNSTETRTENIGTASVAGKVTRQKMDSANAKKINAVTENKPFKKDSIIDQKLA